MNSEITFSELTIEARTEVIKEAAEETSWAIEKTEEKMARLVELLLQQRQAVGHGGWLPWIRETFGDTDASVWKVQRWLRNDRSNNARRIICEDMPEPDITPRSGRKTGAVEVVEPGQPSVQPDNDPAPAPPTNRKTAKGSEKVKEADKPARQAVVPEIVAEAEESPAVRIVFALRELNQVLGYLVEQSEKKKTAKQLRKLADELDPPTSDGDTIEPIPKASHVKSLIPVGLSEELDSAVWQWLQYKQRNADKVYRYKTMQACGKDMKHLQNRLKELGEQAILKMLSEAEQRGWRSWDPKIDNANGKVTVNGHAKTSNGRSRGLTAEDVFSTESLGRHSEHS